jgi:hypothetical protein
MIVASMSPDECGVCTELLERLIERGEASRALLDECANDDIRKLVSIVEAR